MADVLFVKTSSLGDVIHHMPALTEARAHCPDARFAWVVEEAFVPLINHGTEPFTVDAVAGPSRFDSSIEPFTASPASVPVNPDALTRPLQVSKRTWALAGIWTS